MRLVMPVRSCSVSITTSQTSASLNCILSKRIIFLIWGPKLLQLALRGFARRRANHPDQTSAGLNCILSKRIIFLIWGPKLLQLASLSVAGRRTRNPGRVSIECTYQAGAVDRAEVFVLRSTRISKIRPAEDITAKEISTVRRTD